MSRGVRILSGVGLLAAAAALAAVPTRAADDKAASKSAPVDALVRDLGHPSAAVRDQATRELWRRGKDAIPALQKAARGSDPEAARRARSVLDTFAWNIYPDTPPAVVEQIRKFQSGWSTADAQPLPPDNGRPGPGDRVTGRGGWVEAVVALLGMGDPGKEAVRAFLRRGLPPEVHTRLVQFLFAHFRKFVPVLLLDGKTEEAARWMSLHAAGTTPEGAADYAAFLYLRGNLPAVVADAEASLKRGADPATTKLVLAHLYRATGDWAKARAAADGFPRPANGSSITEMLLEEQGDWAALADGVQFGRVNHPEALELTLLRLAGRKKEFDDLAKATFKAARGPGSRKDAVVALLFNHRTDEATELLRDGQQELGLLAEILMARMRYKEALAITPGKDEPFVTADATRERVEFDIRRARTLALLGNRDEAAALFRSVAADLGGGVGVRFSELERIARSLLRAELRAGMRDLAAEHAGRFLAGGSALQRAMTTGETAFEILFNSDAPAAEGLYYALRGSAGGGRPLLARVRDLLAGTAPKADVEAALTALAGDPEGPDTVRPPGGFRSGATADPRNQAVNRLLAKAAVHRGAKQYKEAEEALVKAAAEAAESPGGGGPRSWAFGTSDASGPWVELVDFLYDRGRYADAAAKAEEGWRKFTDRPLLLFLSGRAKLKAGDAAEGRRRMDLSHWASLGNERVRGKFLDELVRRGEAAAAKRETELLLKACWCRDYFFGNVMNQAARAAVLNKDFPLAELCVQRSLLTLMRMEGVYFVESAAYFTVPHDMRIYRARGLLAAGKVDEAVAAVRECLAVTPGHVGLVSGVVPELDKLGRKKEADELYGIAVAAYRKVLADYPAGPSARNALAALGANCRRDLDAALKYAEEAVKAVPDSDAYRETLAEVHFRRGDRDKAVAVMTKLLEEYPRTRLYHRQLQRYKTGSLDSPTPETEDE